MFAACCGGKARSVQIAQGRFIVTPVVPDSIRAITDNGATSVNLASRVGVNLQILTLLKYLLSRQQRARSAVAPGEHQPDAGSDGVELDEGSDGAR